MAEGMGQTKRTVVSIPTSVKCKKQNVVVRRALQLIPTPITNSHQMMHKPDKSGGFNIIEYFLYFKNEEITPCKEN